MTIGKQNSIAFTKHNHDQCVAESLVAVEASCAEQGLNLTPVRREVLKVLLAKHRAVGAYAILDFLRDAGFKSQPPVAYRALEFLTENGFAHKIERLNAFVACSHPCQDHTPAFMICRKCQAVAETPSISSEDIVVAAAKASGFKIERTVLEVEGICPDCAPSSIEESH